MALRASHLSQREQHGQQPSIFDLISQESLMTSLKPAVGHLVKYLASTYPARFLTAHKYYDELYLLFDFTLQNQYLKKYGGSFAENFYSIKRIVQTTNLPPNRAKERFRSLVVLVLWPYISDKLDKLHEKYQEIVQYMDKKNMNASKSLMVLFVKVWPWIKSILKAATVILQILYILNRSSIHSPLLWFSGVRLEKLTPQDIESFEEIPRHLMQSGFLNRIYRLILGFPGYGSRLFGYGLFFVQFIDFMYNSDLGSQLKEQRGSWKVPPAPHAMLTEESVQSLDTNKCPLCMKRRVNDTAVSSSGYVFCYSCIDNYVRQYEKCPVTGLPTTSQQLIRLFVR